MSNSPVNVQITASAIKHIRNQLELTQADYLRLGVKESGCNGYMYMLDYLEAPQADDHCLQFDEGVRVCVSDADKEIVAGTEIDLITEGLNSALVFKNPKATSYCGCGESFAVAPDNADGDTPAIDPDSLATKVGA